MLLFPIGVLDVLRNNGLQAIYSEGIDGGRFSIT